VPTHQGGEGQGVQGPMGRDEDSLRPGDLCLGGADQEAVEPPGPGLELRRIGARVLQQEPEALHLVAQVLFADFDPEDRQARALRACGLDDEEPGPLVSHRVLEEHGARVEGGADAGQVERLGILESGSARRLPADPGQDLLLTGPQVAELAREPLDLGVVPAGAQRSELRLDAVVLGVDVPALGGELRRQVQKTEIPFREKLEEGAGAASLQDVERLGGPPEVDQTLQAGLIVETEDGLEGGLRFRSTADPGPLKVEDVDGVALVTDPFLGPASPAPISHRSRKTLAVMRLSEAAFSRIANARRRSSSAVARPPSCFPSNWA